MYWKREISSFFTPNYSLSFIDCVVEGCVALGITPLELRLRVKNIAQKSGIIVLIKPKFSTALLSA
jgi:hypothetical protein